MEIDGRNNEGEIDGYSENVAAEFDSGMTL
jgi:hypothetical protein